MGAFWWYVAVVHTVSANLKYLYLYPFEAEKIKMKQVGGYMSAM